MGKKFITYNGTIVGNGGLTLLSTETDTPTPPSEFTNCKSLTFDGVDDFVDCGNPTSLQITGELTISFWYKCSSTSDQSIITKDNLGQRSYGIWNNIYATGNNLQFYVFNSNSATSISSSTDFNDGNWHHIVCIFKPSTYLRIYANGSLDAENTTSIPTSIDNDSADFLIGGIVSSGNPLYMFQGNVDEVAVWNSDQSSNVATIYNSGVPNDISSLFPISWWRCGDGDTYPTLTDNGSGGNDGTMTNMSSDSIVYDVPLFNTRSILFDGTDDYVDCGTNLALLGSSTTFSSWVKMTDATSFRILHKGIAGSREYAFGVGTSNTLFLILYNGSTNYIGKVSTSTMTSYEGQWIHICATYDGSTNASGITLYINGSVFNSNSINGGSYTAPSGNNNGDVYIGRYNIEYADGLIDETAVFNSELSQSDVTSIYNNGIPNDISSLSPLSWWRMGDGDSYPTLIDRGSGNNNGTMTNMSSSSIVDDVPLYSNKSFTFDGTDDFVSVTNSNILDGLQKATWSFWFTKSGTSAKYLSSHYNNGNQFLFLFIPSSNRIDGYINGVRAFNNNSTTISVDTWYSAVFVLDSTLSSFSDRLKLFIDGTQITNTGGAQLQQNSTLNSDSGDILIGKATTGFNWDGNIDEVSIFNTALSQSDVTSIYNSGEPNDISCLSPLSWWRMGEDATFDGTNWTLVDNGSGDNDGTSQNMGLSSISNDVPTIPFSTRSIALDGVDDYVDCENPTSLQITNTMTLSAWVKTTDTSTYEIIIGKDSISTGTRSFLLYRSGSVARFLIFNSSGTEFVEGTTTINDGNWHHIMGVNDGTDLKIYVNGTLEGTNVGGGGTFLNGISPFNIGRRATAPANRGYFTGTIDEVAVWNSDQSANASAIGSTIPTDLSSYNPLSWWRCGDGDTAPTLTDNGSGGNNGTMANFTTFSTDVPR